MGRYKIAEICVEVQDDGTITYWTHNMGYHPGQGGMEFVYGNRGSDNLDLLMDRLKEHLTRDQSAIESMVKSKQGSLN